VAGEGDNNAIPDALAPIFPVFASLFDDLFLSRSLPALVLASIRIILHWWYGGSYHDVYHGTAPSGFSILFYRHMPA
jgi:hypothetical protein